MSARNQYTDNERIVYHLKRTKKGAKSKDGKRLSDFIRGKHSAKAEALIAKKDRWIKNNPDKLSSENLKRHQASLQRRRERRRAFANHKG